MDINSDKDSSPLSIEPPPQTSSISREEEDKISQFFPAIVEVPELPEAKSIPLPAMAILCLRACGMSIRDMASAMKISRGSVEYSLRQHDPHGKFVLNPAQMKAVQIAFVRSKRVAALAHITDEKLRQAPAKDLAHITARLWEQEADMESDSPSGKRRIQDDLLQRVKSLNS
jgi:hypothetical protein